MDIQEAIQYLRIAKGVMLISEADSDDDVFENIEKINAAIDMGINALTIMEYIGNKEGSDGKNET